MSKLLSFKNKAKFEFINKTETTAEILLYGPIGEDFFGEGITAKRFTEELKKLPSSVKEIQLRLNSPGGSVFEGMVIYERLKQHKAKVVAYVDGLAASIASVIAMAADEIIMGEGAQFMIHKPIGGVYGNAIEHERIINILDGIESQMLNIYAKKTGMSKLQLTQALEKETWYTADQAIENGFADKTFEAKDSLLLAASAAEGCTWFKNMPKMKSREDFVRDQIKQMNSKAEKYLKS